MGNITVIPKRKEEIPGLGIADVPVTYGNPYLSNLIRPRILIPCHPLFIPGYYYASPLIVFSPSDISWDNFPANTLYVFAYPIPKGIRTHKIAIEIGGASANSDARIEMALYTANWVTPLSASDCPLGMPKDLLLDMGYVQSNSVGVKTNLFAGAKDLPADLYWLALNNNVSDVDLVGGKATSGIFGYSESPINASGFSIAYTYGSWPSLFPWDSTKTAHKIGLRFGFWVGELL